MTGGAVRGRSTRTALRAAVVAAVALPMAGGLLLAAAPAASAAVQSPGEGAVFATDTTVNIRADYPGGTSALTLTSPGGPEVTVATGGSQFGGPGTLTYGLDTACWTYPSSSCSGRVPAPNGTWTLTQTGSAQDRVTFVVRIAPATPDGVTAEALDTRQVRLSWRRGAEPDLQGYLVQESGATLREVPAASCDGGTCSTTLAYEQEGTGAHSYVVKAVRSDGGGGRLESGGAETSATLAAPPRAADPEAPSGGGGSGTGGGTGGSGTGGSGTGGSGSGTGGSGSGGTGTGGSGSGGSGSGGTGTGGSGSGGGTGGSGSGTGGSGSSGTPPLAVGTPNAGTSVEQAVAQRKAFALSFSAFGPKLGIPKLPPLPQAVVPDVAPEPDGTFEPTLGFEDQVVTERTEAQSPAQRVTSVVGNALDSEQLVRSTAAALVLLLCGAHLRRWLGAAPQD